MDDSTARAIAGSWQGSGGLVPRGPKTVLGCVDVDPSEVELRGRPSLATKVWRVEVGGRFLLSDAVVYPGGVPFPEDLRSRTAIVCNEVWLYIDENTQRVVATYWWPEAVRRPIASRPQADFDDSQISPASDPPPGFDLDLDLDGQWQPGAIVDVPDGFLVLLTGGGMPELANEMVIYQEGGLTLRVGREPRIDVREFCRRNQPPYREFATGRVGREPGRALGPHTWPWPGELRWWQDDRSFELRGFAALSTLNEVASAVH